MWQDCIAEIMSSHISISIWGLWCPQPEGETVCYDLCLNYLYLINISYSSGFSVEKWIRTGTRSLCSCRQNSRICSRSAAPHQSCAPTDRPICDPKPDKDPPMENKQHYVCFRTYMSLRIVRILCAPQIWPSPMKCSYAWVFAGDQTGSHM